jgi:beta-glucanase (GH16 family)
MLTAMVLAGVLFCGCGASNVTNTMTTQSQAATPTISTTAALNGAVIVSLATTSSAATIYYTVDGSTPTTSSLQYFAPFLVASNLTVKAIATASGVTASNVVSQGFTPSIASGTLVWSDEFANSGASNAQPNPQVWTYDTGTDCCGNDEWEDYCAWGSAVAPCNPASPNAYVGTDGYLHIVAQQPSPGVYAAGAFTSARLKTQGLFSFQYGRIEASIMLPESQGMWPAFWLLGNNIATSSWPACGEADVMEHIDGGNPPINGSGPGYDWVQSSVHGANMNGGTPYTVSGFSAAGWHKYGMIWTKGQVQFYVDNPSNIYETFTPNTQTGTWPFDQGPQFVILNLAVGGTWPGYPNSTTVTPSTMLVDYVRIYTN